jgi:hypothetical protein
MWARVPRRDVAPLPGTLRAGLCQGRSCFPAHATVSVVGARAGASAVGVLPMSELAIGMRVLGAGERGRARRSRLRYYCGATASHNGCSAQQTQRRAFTCGSIASRVCPRVSWREAASCRWASPRSTRARFAPLWVAATRSSGTELMGVRRFCRACDLGGKLPPPRVRRRRSLRAADDRPKRSPRRLRGAPRAPTYPAALSRRRRRHVCTDRCFGRRRTISAARLSKHAPPVAAFRPPSRRPSPPPSRRAAPRRICSRRRRG